MSTTVWLRAETKSGEHRTPLTPSDAASLVEQGIAVHVEESAERIFADASYATAGCRIEAAGSWMTAPADVYVLGIKELPDEDTPLLHRHIYFGHAYKGQAGASALLDRFVAGGGSLLDLEFLVDADGRRLAAFGYWAGFAGAALGVRQWAGRRREGPGFVMSAQKPVADRQELVGAVGNRLSLIGDEPRSPRAVVIGALGRCGRGATALFEALELTVQQWDVEETAAGGPFPQLLDFDLVVNTVLLGTPIPPFLTRAEIDRPDRRLSVIADVSCDPGNPGNPLPFYDRVTSFPEPALRVVGGDNPLDVIAIDHLPSLLPRESSIDFSAQLAPLLARLPRFDDAWQRCAAYFEQHRRKR